MKDPQKGDKGDAGPQGPPGAEGPPGPPAPPLSAADLLALLLALFGIVIEAADINDVRDKICQFCLRVDRKQDCTEDEKGRARNNTGAQVGDPGWYYGPGGGGAGYGGVIGAPHPRGPGGYVGNYIRRMGLIDTIARVTPPSRHTQAAAQAACAR